MADYEYNVYIRGLNQYFIVMSNFSKSPVFLFVLMTVFVSCSGRKYAKESQMVSSAVEFYVCDEGAADIVRRVLPSDINVQIYPETGYPVCQVFAADTVLINDALAAVADSLPSGIVLRWGSPASDDSVTLYALKAPDGKPALSGYIISDAFVDENEWSGIFVTLVFTADGGEQFEKLTSDNIGSGIAVVVNGQLYCAPRVMDAITSGKAQIVGDFTLDEAERIVEEIMSSAVSADSIPGLEASQGQRR